MKWFSTLQRSTSLEKALHQAVDEARQGLGTKKIDFGLLFVSAAFRPAMIDLWSNLRNELGFKHLLGCTAGGVIGGGKEVEDEPALSLTAATLPGVELVPFSIQQDKLPDLDGGPKAWREMVGVDPALKPSFMVLSDPFSIESDSLISGLDFAYPGSKIVGGLASGGMQPNENLLMLGERIQSRGAVGLAFTGNIRIETVVAQGCRPIGTPLAITGADGNVLMGVDNKPPLGYLQELYEQLNERDRELLQTSLFLGIVMDPFKNEPKQGDFLIRNIIGLDQTSGVLAIGANIRVGQMVQFHLRDAETSRDDLKLMLSKSGLSSTAPDVKQAGAVLFSCMGRGRRLYGEPDHDSGVLKNMVGNIPVGGFFCNGEIGPVGGRTYLHGYTSSIAFFTPDKRSAS